jgi:hypothetical protein
MGQEISTQMVVTYLPKMVMVVADILVVVAELLFTAKTQHGREKQRRTEQAEHRLVPCILTAVIVGKMH